MRFKISLAKIPAHNAAVTCVGWSSTEEVYSAGEDNKLLSWSVSNNESAKVTDFNSDLYPTSLHFLPRASGSLGKYGDLILLTSSDGKFHIVNRNGRIERTVDAHKGAILMGQWSHDGAGLLTAGEDGFVKIWSRGGMLRSTVVQSDNSVYDACWSPDSQAIVYTQGQFLIIKQLTPNTKPVKWRAHEGLILCLSWSSTCELIVSGAEDCRYKVWDSQGRCLFSSSLHEHPITSVAWSPNGDLFAIGSYNTLRLCDFSGWSRSLDKPQTGSIYKLDWSNDGTQVAGGCANGQVLFAHVIERQVHYLNYTAVVKEKKTIVVQNISDDTSELLELPERVIQIALKYMHLVVTTPTQCYIYNSSNWSTPNIFDLKDGSVILLLLSEKNLVLVERSTVSVYNYQGRLVASPRWPNMRLEILRASHISLSVDTLAVCDVSNLKTIYIMDLTSSRNISDSIITITHPVPILQIALAQSGIQNQRYLAILDRNRDLHLTQTRTSKSLLKLGNQIQSFQWNTEENMLAAVQDIYVIIWYFPTSCFNSALLNLSSFEYNSTELGRSPRINFYIGNFVSVRRADGSLLNVPTSPFPTLLHKHIRDNKWEEALRLCRMIKDKILWTGLAVLATQSNNSDLLEMAAEAYAAIGHFDKVFYVAHVKNLPTKAQQMAGAALLGGSLQTAESILLHNGLVYHAIQINTQLHQWNRALELAIKHKSYVDVVLYLREKYLNSLGKEENNPKFIDIKSTVQIDKEKIEQKLKEEN
ncbi:hypothetical protein FQR65_LT02727 [Abscondita terminalis]|nr:hypothetical protein FQR65_LT02727 [Abscondita terminalis]